MSKCCSKNNGSSELERTRDQLISNLCDIILVIGDYPDYKGTEIYIENLNELEVSILKQNLSENEKIAIRSIVSNKLDHYLKEYRANQTDTSPFEFDSGDAYKEYRNFFLEKFKNKTSETTLPPIFECVFQCIKESSEHYRLFENFYFIRREDVVEIANKTAETVAYRATGKVIKNIAEEAAQEAAKNAAHKAEIHAEIAADNAKNAAERAVKNEMSKVSQTVSETTVTVLGIFAAIILTVVAGLMYSSSMLDNMNAANYYRLIAVGSLVGFVCFNLVAVLLRFISKYRHSKKDEEKESDKNSGYSKMMFFVSCALLLIFIVFSVLQFYFSDPLYCDPTHCNFK